MKVGDLVRWRQHTNRHDKMPEWVGLIVNFEEPSFVHVLWSKATKPWTWIHRDNIEVLDESW